MSKQRLQDLMGRHYETLEGVVNDLAQRSTGGEEASINFPNGRVTIKLR